MFKIKLKEIDVYIELVGKHSLSYTSFKKASVFNSYEEALGIKSSIYQDTIIVRG